MLAQFLEQAIRFLAKLPGLEEEGCGPRIGGCLPDVRNRLFRFGGGAFRGQPRIGPLVSCRHALPSRRFDGVSAPMMRLAACMSKRKRPRPG